jgi:amino acid permease
MIAFIIYGVCFCYGVIGGVLGAQYTKKTLLESDIITFFSWTYLWPYMLWKTNKKG